MARVTITLPAELAKRTDAEARRLDRSRSWVVAEALRRFLVEAARAGEAARASESSAAVSEPAAPVYAVSPGLGEQRLAQLEADLKLTPEQRVHAAEEAVELALRVHRPPRRAQVLAFESWEDYLRWKRRDVLW